MKRSTSHRTAVLLLVGLVCLAFIQANPSAAREDKQIELASAPFGITEGQTVSLSVVVYGSRPISMNDAVDARMQLLDADGEVIAESQNIGVLPVQVRSWVVPRELLPTGEPRVKLFESNGTLIAESPDLIIPAGESRSFEVDRANLPVSAEPTGRQQVRVQLATQARSGDREGLLASFEIIETSSGRTTVHANNLKQIGLGIANGGDCCR